MWKASEVREWVLLYSRKQYGEAEIHDSKIRTPASRRTILEQRSIRHLASATFCQGVHGSLILIDKSNLMVQMLCPTRSLALGAALPP